VIGLDLDVFVVGCVEAGLGVGALIGYAVSFYDCLVEMGDGWVWNRY